MLLLLAISCGKDHIENTQVILENETISGQVFNIPEDYCCNAKVAIIKDISVDTLPTYDTLAIKEADDDGKYLFDNIIPEQENLFITLVEPKLQVRASDVTPDGDDQEDGPYKIGVYLHQNENDDGNNFEIIQSSNPCLATIQGSVYISTIGNLTPQPNQPINLYTNKDNAPDQLLSTTITDQNGDYKFEINQSELDAIIVLDTTATTVPIIDMQGYDTSTEANEVFLAAENQIHCLITDSCIIDNDNNFIINSPEQISSSISGYVRIDTNNDGIGDMPAPGKRVELYHRNADNVPMTPLVNGSNTDADGQFVFNNLEAGEYVLYYIGDGSGPPLVASYDQDQEAGEPNGPELIFIPVNILNVGDTDENNYFILSD